jgi:dihydroorotate dehydrogenase (fumarate)
LKDVIKKSDASAACFGDVLNQMDVSCSIVKKVRATVDIPIMCKMPPSIRSQSKEVASALHDAGANGVEMYANNKGTRVNIEKATPYGFGCGTMNSHGHLSETVYDVAQLVMSNPKVNIMAGRGVRRWEDAVELLMVGATVVEICTTGIVYGANFVQEFLLNIEQFMNRKKYAGIDDLRGVALKKVLMPSEIKDKVTPVFAVVIPGKCSACGRCEEVCAYEAAAVAYKKGRGVAKITESKCVGCTLCSQICPEDAIVLKERDNEGYLKALMSRHPEL